jgi:hypothetical protein
MTPLQVWHAVMQAGGRLTPNGEKLIVEAPAPLSQDVMALVRQHKAALLALLPLPLSSTTRPPESETPLDTSAIPVPDVVAACTHMRTGHRGESSNEGEPHLTSVIPPMSHWPNSSRACYACGTMRRWCSVYGAVVCAQCHPPADAALVAVWAGEA